MRREDAQKTTSASLLVPIHRPRTSNLEQSIRKPVPDTSDKDELLIHYQTIPDRRFSCEQAHQLIKQIIDERLETAEYSCACAVISKELSDSIIKSVKKLVYDRYKLICYVAIGQIKDSVLNCASRAVWSPTADTFTEYIFKNKSLFALCILYAVYKE